MPLYVVAEILKHVHKLSKIKTPGFFGILLLITHLFIYYIVQINDKKCQCYDTQLSGQTVFEC